MNEDSVWDCVMAIILAAKDLETRERHLTNQEHNILWDAQEVISHVVSSDLLFRMRQGFSGNPEAPGVAVDLSSSPEIGRGGVRQ